MLKIYFLVNITYFKLNNKSGRFIRAIQYKRKLKIFCSTYFGRAIDVFYGTNIFRGFDVSSAFKFYTLYN